MLSDFKFAFRQLAKTPAFTAIALVTLALGIGLNTSMFSLMNLLILKPLPYPETERLVRIYRTNPQSQSADHSAADYIELKRETADFAELGTFRDWGYTLNPEGRAPVNLNSLRVSSSFLSVLGLKPEIGRWFTAEEDDPGNHVIILSYETWQAHFGGDPAIVGQNVLIDGESTTVVGVMPASFTSIFLWGPADALRPLGLSAVEKERSDEMSYSIIGRRSAALTHEQLGSRLAVVAGHLREIRGKERSQDGLLAVTLESTARNPGTTSISWLMVGLGGFVLLIACANLANLQVARAVARAHEFAIRAALGASRTRLLRPLLAESMLLAVGGGLCGILVALWSNDWISSRLSSNGIFRLTLELDWRVLSFALAASLATGVLFGILPAWLLSRVRVHDSLKSGTRGNTGDRVQNRLQQGLIITQFANAVILLTSAAGFIGGADKLITVNPGWDREHITQAVINLPPARYATPEQSYSFYTRLAERLAALPGAEGSTVGWTLPVFQFLTTRSLAIEGRAPPEAGREPLAYINAVMPSYLPLLGIKLQAGRNFTDADRLGSVPVAIINASMAHALFPNEDPIGQRIGSIDPKNPGWMEIVGVMPDVGFAVGMIPKATPFQVMRPLAQDTWNYVTVAVRSSSPEKMTEPLRQAVAALDPNLVVQQLGPIHEVTKLITGSADMMTTVLICFALLGLFLAAIGLYGVIARVVVQRTPEIGVRVALGAQSTDVVWLVLRSGLRMTLLGTVLGLAGSGLLGWAISLAAPDVGSGEPLLFLGVSAILIPVGLLACWLPARRASKIDPMVALRAE
ncbi:MAG TPA: ABC transporter permease [Lacunisphaera sp.]|nr:ABC transporter permease [Lacunisphaera sp.]